MIQWGVEWLLRVNYRTWVHHSDWLVWRQRSLEAELALGNFLLFFLWWSTGAVWLHFPSEQHCHRNVTHPCCCVRVRLVRVTLCARHSLLNCKTTVCNTVWVQSSCPLDLCGTSMFVTTGRRFCRNVRAPHLDLSQRKSLLKHFSAVTSDICNVQDLLWKTKYYNSQNMHHTVLILWLLRSLLGNGCWHVIIIMIGLFFRGRRSFRAQTHITNITDKELDCWLTKKLHGNTPHRLQPADS